MFKRIDELDRTFVGLSAWRNHSVAVAEPDGTLRTTEAALVTGNAFDLLGLRPRLGRLLTPADDVPGGPPGGWPVVLSEGYWRERFGSDPSAVGKTIRLSDQPVTVIGVAPGAFHGTWPGIEPAMYLPLHYMSVVAKRDVISPADSGVGVSGLGRLKSGLSVADAQADLAVHERRLIEEFERNAPPELRQRLRMTVESGQTGFPTMFRYRVLGTAVSHAGTRRRGAPPVLRERQWPDALEAARAPARVRGPHGDRRRIAAPRPSVPDRVVRDRGRGRRARRRGRLVWHAADAAVLPHADAGSRHADRTRPHRVPGDGALRDRHDAVLRGASRVARRARQSRRA